MLDDEQGLFRIAWARRCKSYLDLFKFYQNSLTISKRGIFPHMYHVILSGNN
jgi:hypothetical protein